MSDSAADSVVSGGQSPNDRISGRARVCAVVVTFNRKELLRGCLDAVLGQSRPVDRVVVIDNASTDGTGEYLQRNGYNVEARVEHVLLPKNGGGAAGFHHGFKRALDSGADWIWAMDDDGVPDERCLQNLIAAAPRAGEFRGPVVLTREQRNDPANGQLAFHGGVVTARGEMPVCTVADIATNAVDGVLTGYASVFNGVLVHRRLVEAIGLPDSKFFIWGDEWDYTWRARRAGMPPATVLAARYWHPADRTQYAQVRFAGASYNVPRADSPFRNYLLIRNHAYLAHRYRGVIAWLRHTMKYLLYHRTAGGCFTVLQVLRFSIEGLIGRFSGDSDFVT